MVKVQKNGIEWHLTDARIAGVLDFAPLSGERGQHWVRECDNAKIFVKLFKEKGFDGALRNRFGPKGKREYAVLSRLRGLSVATPRPLGFGIGPMCSLSVREWIAGEDFLGLFRGTTDRIPLLRQLSLLLLSLKKGRGRPHDLQTGNIIVSDQTAYLINLHKTSIRRTFGRADEVANMCHALSSIYFQMAEEEKRVFFQLYGDVQIRAAAEGELSRLRADWVQRKKKRAFRSTSFLKVEGDILRVRAATEVAQGQFVTYLKQDRKTEVERFSDHVRKTYRNRRRLKKAWKNHVTLEYMGLAVAPKPFYARRARVGARGFVAMEDLGPRGEEFSLFVDRNYDRMTNREIRLFVGRFSLFLASLLRSGIAHEDLKTSNVLVLDDGGFRLLDVEDFCFDFPVGKDRLAAMLVQLNKSLPRRVATGWRLRFLSAVARSVSLTIEERKALLKSVREASLADVIAYTGISGFVTDSWT
jgi:tRNA A-37 threonylcarbamoyl transferase component Bud32